ncbi:mannosyltransferase [Bizionia myxarmorum]|uniref:Mannosyltransferase n=1 Tax=Bizionia myxarmorum TaxID=291186 RepID=A0A5D0RDZ7_9FLAO|nr:mannosyltransferase [Bizionia myxarmorum]TYB79920.1 mannosyltransferase [Bizionia myxarmorum]
MQVSQFLKIYKFPLLLVFSSVLFYGAFAYNLERTDSIKLLMLYTALFVSFYKIIQLTKHNLQFLTWLAFGFRAVFILAIPNLSQDFYRFIWDGRMILEGFNPYLYTPESFITNGEFPVAQAQELYNGMGALNASHFTNYPPLNQLCFIFAGLFAGKSILGSVVVLRLLIIAADFGILYFGKKLLTQLHLPAHLIFWYILNPFIIIELTGNLHFEGIMLFFLIWSLYLLDKEKWMLAAFVFACSISVKLIPLLFLPLFFKWFRKENVDTTEKLKSAQNNWLKLLAFYGIVGISTICFFLPFYSTEFLNNYANTVALWFQNFEFNASLYYIFRELGFWLSGYNQIAVIGKATAIFIFLFVLGLAYFRKVNHSKQFIATMLIALTVYYFTATTVHPWYVATLVLLGVFTNYRFQLLWSFMIIFSYLAYSNTDNSENLWIIALEYTVVFGVFLHDIYNRSDLNSN